MFLHDLELINELFYCDFVPAEGMDALWSEGWRHFGSQFFRYNFGIYNEEIRRVLPLRIRLADFTLSKAQRRILRRNEDVHVEIVPIEITDAAVELFHRHKLRFDHGIPESIYDFLSPQPATLPCEAKEVRVSLGGRLLAASYFDLGKNSTSGIYGMFDPDESKRSLGIFTMLKEIQFATERGKQFYYLGYAYKGESFYDYKKRFRGTESFDWNDNWTRFDPLELPAPF
ncbi:arginyltransferase [soil metagenome]